MIIGYSWHLEMGGCDMNKITRTSRRQLAGLAAGLVLSIASGAPAIALTDDDLLCVTGDVDTRGGVGLDADALAALPQQGFETSTIWTDGPRRFSGPSLGSVLQHAGAGPGDLRLVAINDYVVDLPRDTVEATLPIIATHIDGQRFTVREKGPLWLVFPYDSAARFQRET